MKKSRLVELDNEELERVVSMAQEERKPFEVIKEEFGISESEVTEIMRKKLSKDNFELWKKKVAAVKENIVQDDYSMDIDYGNDDLPMDGYDDNHTTKHAVEPKPR